MMRVTEREIMEQIKAITQETSDISKNADDRLMGGSVGSGIGNSQPVINLDEGKTDNIIEGTGLTPDMVPKIDNTPTPKEQPEKTPEQTNPTQGEFATQLKEATENIDITGNILDQLKAAGIKSFNLATQLEQIKKTLTDEEYQKARDMIYSVTEPNQAKQYYQGNMKYTLPEAIDYFNTLNSKYTTISHDIRSNSKYDNRTDEQIREDTTVQRKAEDTAKAGLNPKLMSIGAGGGGGGGSAANEEEERKKKKKKNAEEKKQKEMKMLLGAVAAIGGAGLGLGNLQLGNQSSKLREQLGSQANKIKEEQLEINKQYLNMNKNFNDKYKKQKENSPDWVQSYLKELEEKSK